MTASTGLWFVYIIETENGSFYTGITTCLKKRLQAHKTGKGGAKFFKLSPAKKIIFFETASSQSEALKKEAFIKKLSKQQKLTYIQNAHHLHSPN